MAAYGSLTQDELDAIADLCASIKTLENSKAQCQAMLDVQNDKLLASLRAMSVTPTPPASITELNLVFDGSNQLTDVYINEAAP